MVTRSNRTQSRAPSDSVAGRLHRLRSDLADSMNPKVLLKYPHLGHPDLIAETKAAIEKLEQENT